jgi:quinolinate synthase
MPSTTIPSRITLRPGVDLCQSDLPLDWYQDEFRPYAEEYLALPDRTPETVMPWLDGYVRPAIDMFGPSLLLAAHYYMGGEIVKLVERYGGHIGDSYALATFAARSPHARIIVQSAVHFMAEAIAMLAEPHQRVYITNPKAGCTMEMMAREDVVEPLAGLLLDRYGDELVIIAYMNTSGRIKALAGRTGGATCTSSNAHLVLDWARRRSRRVLFIPDRHLGENTAARIGINPDRIASLPTPSGYGAPIELETPACCDDAELILWGAYCGVHTVFEPAHAHAWRELGYTVLVHPECPRAVVECADGQGSTNQLWDTVMRAPAGSRFAVGTEGHFVRNLKEQAGLRDITVEHLAAAPVPSLLRVAGCGCATMSRNDPPHLAGMLDLLRRGTPPDLNCVLPGDTVSETTGVRDRLTEAERAEMAAHARTAMQRMIDITESAHQEGHS